MRKEIWKTLKDCQVIFLATIEDKQPRVRLVTLMRKENMLFTVSLLHDSKVEQIVKNPKVEFAFSVPNVGFNVIRVECIAEIVEDERIKAEIYNSSEHALIGLIPKKFLVKKPPSFESIIISLT